MHTHWVDTSLCATGNYRSALTDCAQALKYNPGHVKAVYRAGKACFELGKFGEVVRWCDQGLVCNSGNASFLELRSSAVKQKVCRTELCNGAGVGGGHVCSLLCRECLKGTNAKRVKLPRRRQQK